MLIIVYYTACTISNEECIVLIILFYSVIVCNLPLSVMMNNQSYPQCSSILLILSQLLCISYMGINNTHKCRRSAMSLTDRVLPLYCMCLLLRQCEVCGVHWLIWSEGDVMCCWPELSEEMDTGRESDGQWEHQSCRSGSLIDTGGAGICQEPSVGGGGGRG